MINSDLLRFSAPKRESASASPTPGLFSLAKGGDEEEVQAKAQQENGVGEQVSAADYDPSLDRREDEHKRVWGGKEDPVDVEMVEEEEEEEEEDVDDMFAVATIEKKKVKKVKRVVVSAVCVPNYARRLSCEALR